MARFPFAIILQDVIAFMLPALFQLFVMPRVSFSDADAGCTYHVPIPSEASLIDPAGSTPSRVPPSVNSTPMISRESHTLGP
jgi:hypothetical protein